MNFIREDAEISLKKLNLKCLSIMKNRCKTSKTVLITSPIFLALCLLVLNLTSRAQDTLFYEGFNNWPVYMSNIDSVFVNYDEDQIPDANDFPGGWTVGNFANGGADQNEIVAMSSSWLTGFAHGNRNFLRLPGIYISDSTAILKWRSAPALGNLYMDGYTVAVSLDSTIFEVFPTNDTDTLMHFAQNINNDEAQFSVGTKHSSFDLTAPTSPTGVTQYPGLLMPWEASLSKYEGKTIYIVFLHNSDDDNFIALDDILVTGTEGTPPAGISNTTIANLSVSFNIYPNPCNDFMELQSNLTIQDKSQVLIYNSMGQMVRSETFTSSKTKFNVSDFSAGIYHVSITSGAEQSSLKFIKR